MNTKEKDEKIKELEVLVKRLSDRDFELIEDMNKIKEKLNTISMQLIPRKGYW